MPPTTSYFAVDSIDSRDVVAILSTIDQLDAEDPVTVVQYYIPAEDDWGSAPLKGIRCTAFSLGPAGAPATFVGDRGQVWEAFLDGDVQSRGQLPDSGLEGRSLGQPNDIRRIAGKLYVCGFAGQVYTQDANGDWVHIDDGIAEAKGSAGSIDLESIDGRGPDDLYVVGSRGLIAHYDGQRWTRVPALTNVYLARVRCFASDHIVVVGDKGVVLESDGTNWRASHIPGEEGGSLSDVALFNGKLYVAAGNKCYVQSQRGGAWTQVQHGLDPETTTFIRFTLFQGRMWVQGFKRLLSFDGKTWAAHKDQYNP